MNLLFLSTWFPFPPDNGSKIRVYHLLRALGQRHEVTLLSFAFDTARPEEKDRLSAFCRQIGVVYQNPMVRSRAAQLLRFFSPAPIVAAPVEEMQQLVQKTARNVQFDVIIASTLTTATYALHSPHTPKVLEEHNSLTRWMWGRYQSQHTVMQRLLCWASWQKTRYYESRIFKKFDLCTMVSQEDRRASLTMLPGYDGRLEVVPNGVDCERNRPGLVPPVLNTLVYNGALTYSANYDAMQYFLAEVYPLIRQQAQGVSLTITGSTSGVDLTGLRLDESVHFSGYVEDIRPLVAGSAVCVTPIRQGGGTRLKILEAMALGTPVVATSKGAEGLDVTDSEHLLLADDPAAFAEATLHLLRDPALRRRLVANARQRVEDYYDWEQIGRRFVELVEEVGEKARKRKGEKAKTRINGWVKKAHG